MKRKQKIKRKQRMDEFKAALEKCFTDFFAVVATDKSEWTVKGFIDIYKNIYTISTDTKVVSKIIELMIFPVLAKFATDNGYGMDLATHQNHYPDITFVHGKTGRKIALDLKSSYRTGPTRINELTLGAFTGYFRNRTSTKNITYPYSEYDAHYVLGIVYTKTDLFECERKFAEKGFTLNNNIRKALEDQLSTPDDETEKTLLDALQKQMTELSVSADVILDIVAKSKLDERKTYGLGDLSRIMSVVRDFKFFVQEKWRIATDRPGSGNTKNIGSTAVIDELLKGEGPFTKQKDGKALFDAYWQAYMTRDMAKALDMDDPPFKNIATYFQYIESLPKRK